jgi:hypothetical protein
MSTRKIITTILILSIFTIALFIYPSMNQSVRAEQIKFSGQKNQMMTLQDAASLTKTYRINTESTAMLIQYFGKDIIEKALAQPGRVKVHVYYGKNQDGKSGFMIFGVDKKGNETIASIVPVCPKCGL